MRVTAKGRRRRAVHVRSSPFLDSARGPLPWPRTLRCLRRTPTKRRLRGMPRRYWGWYAWIPQIARAAALLHIPDHLADGVETAEEVARIESSDPRSTYRLMRAASSIGLLSYKGARASASPGAAAYFARTSRGRFRACVDTDGERALAVLGTLPRGGPAGPQPGRTGTRRGPVHLPRPAGERR